MHEPVRILTGLARAAPRTMTYHDSSGLVSSTFHILPHLPPAPKIGRLVQYDSCLLPVLAIERAREGEDRPRFW